MGLLSTLIRVTLSLIVLLALLGGLLYTNDDLRIQLLQNLFKESNFVVTRVKNVPPVVHAFDATKNRQWLFKAKPSGAILKETFEFKVSPRPTLKQGEVLLQPMVFGFDPSQIGWLKRKTYRDPIAPGNPMEGFAVCKVAESKNPNFKVGDTLYGILPWQDFTVFNPEVPEYMGKPMRVPTGISPYVFLNIVTDLTAIGGILRIGKIKSGDRVLVSGAAGATGSVAGQAAQLLGATKVVGIAGGEQKKKLLTSQFNFDVGIDYKTENQKVRVNDLFGKSGGVDVFFDNVGGEILDIVLANISHGGRIVLCGAISQYENEQEKLSHDLNHYFNLVLRDASMEGFIVTKYLMDPGVIGRWIYWQAIGKLIRAVDLRLNFDELPNTIINLFAGGNVGKMVLQVDNNLKF